MITCEEDILLIHQSETETPLRVCAERYADTWLPRVLEADWNQVVKALLVKVPFALFSPEESEAATKAAAALTLDQKEARFRGMVANRIAEVQPELRISFQRTLRIPDDDKTYPLPPSLGCFPLRPIERYAATVPAEWSRRGGLLMPMYQAEALWLNFDCDYPNALKVGTGNVNAINGQPWAKGLNRDPQGYVVLPEQPWLDGYCVEKGVIRQFVAARLGSGYSAEEQIHRTTRGGLQLEAFPIRPEVYFEKQLQDELPKTAEEVAREFLNDMWPSQGLGTQKLCAQSMAGLSAMGVGAGGRMKQEIYEDQWEAADWDMYRPSRVWVHLVDALRWLDITGELPPQKPVTASDYAAHGLPWFDYYRDDMDALKGSATLGKLKTVFSLGKQSGDPSIPQEMGVHAGNVTGIGPHAPDAKVTEWDGK